MSYGFSATNNYDQILISSDTRNLHFIGKAYLYSTLLTSDYYGGVRQWSFRIGTARNIVPLPFFTMTGAEYYGVSAVRQISVGNSVILTTAPIPITGQLAKTYTWNSAPLTITEGTDNIYSVTTTNVATGTTLYWDISPSTSNDFQYTDGSFIIDSTGAGSFQITPTKFFDPYPETAENYTINIRTYTPLTGAVVLSQTIVVNNSTSTDITGFGWTTNADWGPSIIAEGSNNTSSAPPGAFVITATQGNNSVITTSAPITLATEFTETYTFSSLALTMNEGTASTVGITSTNVKDGTVVYWEIPNATNEFLITSGSFTVTGNAGSFSVTPTSFYDAFAESAETYSIVLKRFDGTNYNTVKTSSQITVVNVVNASATTGLGWNTDASFGPSSLTEGTVYSGTTPPNVYVVTDANPGNTVYATSFPITIRSQYAETYAFSALTAIVEGTTVAVTITTTNVPNGTVIYWTLNSTNKNNFAVDSGNFTVTANTATFSITPTNVYDAYLESVTDSFTISLSKQFGTQDNLIIETVATSSAITITPASTTQTTGFGWNKNALWGTDPITEGIVASGTPNETLGTIPANVFVVTETNPANTVIVTSPSINISADANTGGTMAIYPDTASGWSNTTPTTITLNGQGGLHVVTSYPQGTILYWYLSTGSTGLDARSHNFDEISGYITIGAPTAAAVALFGSSINYAYITLNCVNTADDSIVYGSTSTPYQLYPAYYNSTSTEKYWSLKLKVGNSSGAIVNGSNYNLTMTGITYSYSTTKLRWSGIWGSPDVVEGTAYTYRINGNGTPVAASWQIVHITTQPSDFSATSGTFTTPVGQLGQSTFNVTPLVDNLRESYNQFRIQVTDANGNTITSPVITIAPSIDTTAPTIQVPITVTEGTAFNCTVYTVGLADGLYYWRINKPSTTGSGIADYTPTSYGTSIGDFNSYYGSVTITGNTGSFTVPAPPNNDSTEPTETFTISLVTKTTVSRNWSVNPVSPATTTDFPLASLSGTTTPGGFNWSYFIVNATADSLTEGTEKFTISIKDSSNNVLCTSGQISILDVSQATLIAPYFTGASKITEGTANTYTVYTTGLTDGTYYWRTNDVTTSTIVNQNNSGSNEFLSQWGTITITGNTGTFSITANSDSNTEFDEQFTISIVGNAATNYRYWSVNPVLPATTADFPVASLSGVCTPGGYNWWYFTVNATADSLTEGTEKFTISIRETSTTGTVKFTSGQISILDVSVTAPVLPYITGPTTVVEGIANTYTVYTTGLTNGTYYWRINDINTSTVPGITPTSTGDFTTSWGTVTITNNTGTFNVAAYADGTLEYDEQFTISLVNKAAADKYWTISHISTDPNGSDFQYTSGACTPGGYNWWYFNVNAVADSQTEGTEKFTVQVRQGSTTGTVLTTSGAISITDTSLGNYAVLPASTQEAVNFNVTIFTPSIAAGTTLYWDINHITTSDLDFVTTFGSFVSATAGAVITLSTINYDAAELDEGFTISVRTQPKYIWEIELIRSGTSNTVPEVYVFAQPDAAPVSLTETMGLKVMRDDGTPSFDSRLGPLVISAATAVTFPSNPRPSLAYGLATDSCNDQPNRAPTGGNASGAFIPTEENAYNLGSLPAKPIYFLPTLAQAERQQTFSRSWDFCKIGEYKGACIGDSRVNYKWTSTYWCFYRGGIRRNGNYIYSGWIAVDWWCNSQYYEADVVIGNDYGAPRTSSGGEWPYSNETINLSAAAVLISDGALYD